MAIPSPNSAHTQVIVRDQASTQALARTQVYTSNVELVLDFVSKELSKTELQQDSSRAKKAKESGEHLLLMADNKKFCSIL